MSNTPATKDELLAPAELSIALDTSNFLVRSKKKVIHMLEAIQARGVLMSLSFSNLDQVAASSLVFVDKTNDMLLLVCPPDWQGIIETGGGDSIMLECTYEDSKIQFQGGHGMIVRLDGVPVVALEIPEFMWRFRRRSAPRPKISGMIITLNLGFLHCDAQVTDISLGGIGIFHCGVDVRLEAGEVLRACTIVLPGVGQIKVDVTVRHQTVVQRSDGRKVKRVDCQFTGLSDGARQLIAHYLGALSEV